jgi:hypothetical protein
VVNPAGGDHVEISKVLLNVGAAAPAPDAGRSSEAANAANAMPVVWERFFGIGAPRNLGEPGRSRVRSPNQSGKSWDTGSLSARWCPAAFMSVAPICVRGG